MKIKGYVIKDWFLFIIGKKENPPPFKDVEDDEDLEDDVEVEEDEDYF